MTETIERPAVVTDEHLNYLDGLRESGIVNMFGASPFIVEEFGASKSDARTILSYWMETFGERHAKPKVKEVKKWMHLDLKDQLRPGEYDPDLAVIEGEDALIVTMHDFVHWVEREEEISVEVFDDHVNSRLIMFTRADLLARATREVDIAEWGHYFGIKSRVATNYHLLLNSMKSTGLATDTMPDWK